MFVRHSFFLVLEASFIIGCMGRTGCGCGAGRACGGVASVADGREGDQLAAVNSPSEPEASTVSPSSGSEMTTFASSGASMDVPQAVQNLALSGTWAPQWVQNLMVIRF